MNKPIIKIENLGKQYRLGAVGTGTLSHDINRWWYKVRGKEDPYLKVGDVNDRTSKGGSDYVWALKDINFEVQPGEILGIIGKNGAGKSTLLKLLSRVTAPSTGKITCHGRIASLLEVGTGFHPELTGRENIYLNGAILGMTKKEIADKFDEIVDFAGCAKYIDTPVKRYSSGMYVRLAFAVAAHLEPDILVVDEVLAVGDAEFQKKAIGKMKEVSEGQGRTVLFVSHNLGTIQALCTKTLILQNGGLIFNGETSKALEIYTKSSKGTEFSSEKRKGSQNVIIENLEIKKLSNSKVSNDFRSGEGITIEYSIKANDLDYLNKPIQLGAQIFNSNGTFLTAFNNQTKGVDLILDKQNQSFKCVVDRMPFMNGRHYINVGLIVDGVLNDYIEEAISFDVIAADFFDSGYSKLEKRAGVYIDHNWI
ncbi:ABC transporter ATP-binding protein [Winogradskyella sp. SYSU M77433]|uniref:ABC transporter ATP-binding protein n=1 Tax=Winogradskyella sp. SYSU M77433 TaxID=3042722 RepID=UPI0024817BE3|nr:ABC transporter ATP-binding protein [Winogradskyella sp. SYSU M77433]MDH7911526.1 ABC transporter ATP-binding protein [Winogradskyella sp. SYSU M77433]